MTPRQQAYRMWIENIFEQLTHDPVLDFAVYAWRVRFFESDNNPFR